MSKTERKIAVVLIHGIGDQQPLATLRSFVESILEPNNPDKAKALYWSKPDAVSGSFDLRRFQCAARNDNGLRHPPIDFYEYYWAHRMEGTVLDHTVQWLNMLLFRRPSSVPSILRQLWWLCWVSLIATTTVIAVLASDKPLATLGVLATLTVGGARLVADRALRDWVGDAARYFSSRPANIAVRESIRRGGVDLLEGLHTTGDYQRIIVIDHSLGSAIALDILHHHWTLAREKHARPDRPRGDAVAKLEAALKNGEPIDIQELRSLQKQVWSELRENGVPWRVSDLITLGSPLTHFPFLVGLDENAFKSRVVQREIPSAPPVLDGKGIVYWSRYLKEDGQQRSIGVLHHAACFAATRWTNIYFPHRGLFKGDPVGGPLASLFGSAIEDIEVATKRWHGRLNHLDYWRDDPRDTDPATRPRDALIGAMAFSEAFRKPGAGNHKPK